MQWPITGTFLIVELAAFKTLSLGPKQRLEWVRLLTSLLPPLLM